MEKHAWSNALDHVRALSQGGPLDRNLRVTVHFHPDVPSKQSTMIAILRKERLYRSQFETKSSNGGLTAFRGGDRWRWESRLFGGHYDADNECNLTTRPKYGSLNFRNDPYGGSPRFGSCYLRLAEETLDRTSFCHPDSVLEPTDFGTADRFSLIEIAENRPFVDPIDGYVEAHVHGPIRLPEDVEAVVLDPCYRGTDVEDEARSLGCALEWHPGYKVGADELQRHPDYRGLHIVALATRIAEQGVLTPQVIGRARAVPELDPQDLKKVWHSLACYGRNWQVVEKDLHS